MNKIRELAYDWNSGLDSAIYAFASSGDMGETKDALISEINTVDDVSDLYALLDFVIDTHTGRFAPWHADYTHYACFDRFEIGLTTAQIESIPTLGDCGPEIEALIPELVLQLDADNVRRELESWGLDDLDDDQRNLERIVWLAVCNIREEGEF